MAYYRITITPLGPLGTEIVSGTLWGHLAWAIRYGDGEEGLGRWLSEQGERPWLLSSFMPAGMLPRPILKPLLDNRAGLTLKEMKEAKERKKEKLIPEALFLRLRKDLNESTLQEGLEELRKAEASKRRKFSESDLRPHNRIDRLTGATPETGGLYFEESRFFDGKSSYQGFAFTSEPALERLKILFEFIGERGGFGANASTGNGCFHSDITEETLVFASTGNRAMSISHGVLSNNMLAPRYKQHAHFGKLGGHFATEAFSPFKYPILMMCPGATFRPADAGPFGMLLSGVHHDPALACVRHHALHLPIFFTETEP